MCQETYVQPCVVNHFSKTIELLAAVNFRLSWRKQRAEKKIMLKGVKQEENLEMRKETQMREFEVKI
jgi:hypothetical protein